ncbi:MAG: glycosyltransferase family 4 protein [Archaeoglobi archaeon]|nr:glycosyltransferase family 4 protein [Candidatus Mnemosynella sp.]
MRIALVSDWYYPKVGGVASHMHDLAFKLKERSHKVTIVTNDRRTGKEKELEAGEIELLKIPGFLLPGLDLNLSYGFKSPNTLTDFLKDFDIIHSHHAFTPLALKALEAGRKLGAGSILTNHSISFAYDSHLWKFLGFTIPVFRLYLNKAHRIIAVSESARAFIEHFTSSPVSVIPNGVDTEKFFPAKDKEKLKEKFGIEGDVILYVGRMSFRKGPHVLLNAFSSIPNATLVMVGSGELLPFLRAQTKILGIEERVVFTGHVSEEKLSEIYRMADIFVLPSITSEAFGIVLLEAMASGVPVIASDTGGIREIISGSGAGLLVTPENELELRKAIEKLLKCKNLREEYGERGRELAERKYSWKVVVPKIEELYDEVLSCL